MCLDSEIDILYVCVKKIISLDKKKKRHSLHSKLQLNAIFRFSFIKCHFILFSFRIDYLYLILCTAFLSCWLKTTLKMCCCVLLPGNAIHYKIKVRSLACKNPNFYICMQPLKHVSRDWGKGCSGKYKFSKWATPHE